ncbi:MAG: PAS domain S-box protein, partial [Desulfomonile sp.]|nr:PAS domain S-box protein [Desulfomonile sp.]
RKPIEAEVMSMSPALESSTGGPIEFDESMSVRVALIRQLYSQAHLGLYGSLAGAVLLVAGLWSQFPQQRLLVWFVLLAITQLSRLALLSRFRRMSPPDEITLRYGQWFLVGSCATAILWGVFGFVFFPAQSFPHQCLLALFLGGIALTTIVGQAPLAECFVSSTILTMTPMSIRFFHQGDSVSVVVGLMSLLFALVLIGMGYSVHGMIKAWARLKFQRAGLVEQLEAGKTDLENHVHQRTDELVKANEVLKAEIAARQKTEQALRESEERYRVLAENSLTGIYVHQDGKFVYINNRAAQVLGYTPKELIGRFIWDFVAVEDRDRTRDIVANRYRGTEIPSPYEFKLVTRSGETRWAAVLATVISHEGRPATLANVIDITDQKRAESALRESEARYRELFENASDIIYTHDLQGRYTSVNQAVSILGYTPEEFLSLSFTDLIDPTYLPIAQEQFRKKIEDGVISTGPYELLVRAKNGTLLWFEVTSRVIKEGNKPVGVHGIGRDITARKRAEQALAESEEKFRLIVQNASDAILVAQDGVLKFVNPACSTLVGYSEEELTSRVFTDFIHPEDKRLVLERYQRRLRGDAVPNVYPFRVVDKFGSIKWVEINAVLITWAGRPATLNFLTDVTAKRRIEEELAKIERLESLGIVAGGIAHDFNNILTAIVGNISLGKLLAYQPDKLMNRLSEAEKACVQAQGLTQQLLTFAKGGTPIKKLASVRPIVRDSCQFAVRGSNVKCEYSLPDNLWPAEFDEGQIGQIINNLVINADQAMPQGGVIRVAAENVMIDQDQGLPLKDGPYLKITIRDQGIGIPQEILPRIFDPYFTTKRKGSGLGLATSFSIAKNHDGFITAESEPGAGASFSLYLPARPDRVVKPRDERQEILGGSGKILLMDDEESVRDLAAEALTLMGYEVIVAWDGAQAIEFYLAERKSSRPFDLVILDLTVPGGLGGLQTIERILEIDPGVKAIVSSGYSNDPVMSDFAKYGFKGVVAKPYSAKELADVVRRIIAE